MTTSQEDNKFKQLVQKIAPQSKLLRTWKLQGGVSAQVTALEIDDTTERTMRERHRWFTMQAFEKLSVQ